MAKNEITGDKIRSGNRKEDSKKVRDNWDSIFGKKRKGGKRESN